MDSCLAFVFGGVWLYFAVLTGFQQLLTGI